MYRVLLCAAAMIVPSAAWAVPIEIDFLGVVANYDESRDAFDVEFWLSRPIDTDSEWLTIAGHDGREHRYVDSLNFVIENRSEDDLPTELFTAKSFIRRNGVWLDVRTTEDIAPTIRMEGQSQVVAVSFSADDLRLDEMFAHRQAENVSFTALITTNGLGARDSVSGISTYNAPQLIHTPEPSSLALASLSALLLGVHLVRSPSFRKRCVKRHVGGEPLSPRAVV